MEEESSPFILRLKFLVTPLKSLHVYYDLKLAISMKC